MTEILKKTQKTNFLRKNEVLARAKNNETNGMSGNFPVVKAKLSFLTIPWPESDFF